MLFRISQIFFYVVARLLYSTYRFRYFNQNAYYQAKKRHPKQAFCLASWHEHALAGVLGQKGIPYVFLISKSRDGEYVSFLSQKFGFKTIRGSSSRGGQNARPQLLACIGNGLPAAFTVDGPRGPRHRCKPGVLSTALKSNTMILPVAALCRDPWIVKNAWDKSKIPPPFSKIVYQYGEPIDPKDLLERESFEDALLTIGKKINEAEHQAEKNLLNWSKGGKNLP